MCQNHCDLTYLRATNVTKATAALLICLASNGFSQTQTIQQTLETQRIQLLKAIEANTITLSATLQNKESSMAAYTATLKKIETRELLMQNLVKQLSQTNEIIQYNSQLSQLLDDDLNRLKIDYTRLLRTAYRQYSAGNALLFIFTSKNFIQAFQRWQYVKQYDQQRAKQVQIIQQTQSEINARKNGLQSSLAAKKQLLDFTNNQKITLKKELQFKDSLVVGLQNDEQRIRADLDAQERAHAHLLEAIQQLIQGEQIKGGEVVPSAAVPMNENSFSDNKEIYEPEVIAKEFKANKGILSLPVINGVIIRRFGKQAHPTFENLEISNNGIDIQCAANAAVNVVFYGKVVGTQYIPGNQNMVLVQHGNFYTVYANMDEVIVKRGDIVTTNQIIGKASAEKPEIHFEVWQDKTLLNPVNWLVK
jgi:murein hydrolase activator